jgi:hypothetical protein
LVSYRKRSHGVDLRAFKKGRKFFKTRTEAEAEALRQRTLLERHSRALIGLSQREASEIIAAKQKLAEYGETISDAVEFRIDHLERIRRSGVTVAQFADEVVKAKRSDGRSLKYVYDLNSKLRFSSRVRKPRYCCGHCRGNRQVASRTRLLP